MERQPRLVHGHARMSPIALMARRQRDRVARRVARKTETSDRMLDSNDIGMPAAGNVLICCSQPNASVILDL